MENNNQIWEQKDKRISFQGLHGHLCQLGGMTENEIWELTKKRNEELYQMYPFPSEKTLASYQKPTGRPNNASGNDIKCAKCGADTKRKEGIKNGKKWVAHFCQNKECDAPNFESAKQTKKQYNEAMAGDRIDEEAHNQYKNEHQDNYGEYGEPL
jgi:hypothetical protein